ncbi:MAG TPA: UDP-N-acetylglucosamine 2-epimerase (non-hydrolyzing) [Acidimicrobiia bacterium]
MASQGNGVSRLGSLPPRSVALILGTRPELIKAAPVIKALGESGVLIHTGQHFDEGLSGSFIRELGISEPIASLRVGGLSRAGQIGTGVERLEEILMSVQPKAVVVHGDTNATLSGALAANALHMPLVHMEAGLRSFDRRMPEEHNRVVVDHLADLCCAPTDVNHANLSAEGINGGRVVVTGNTIVEAVKAHMPPAAERRRMVADMGLTPSRFVVATMHRPENVDSPGPLRVILEALVDQGMPVLFAAHPRTTRAIDRFGLRALASRLRLIKPMSYGHFLAASAEAALLVSDSGGVQEEASIVKRPVIVVRRSTERPEGLGTFSQLHAPDEKLADSIATALESAHETKQELAKLPTPYGDRYSSTRIAGAIAALVQLYETHTTPGSESITADLLEAQSWAAV